MLDVLYERLRGPKEKTSWPTGDYALPDPAPSNSHLRTIYDVYAAELSMADNEFFKSQVDLLPSTFCVVSLAALNDGRDLIVTRLRANETPFSMRLPLDRHHQTGFETVANVQHELHDIITTSDLITSKGKECQTKDQKSTWWESRRKLDVRLKKLLFDLEDSWFGGFKV